MEKVMTQNSPAIQKPVSPQLTIIACIFAIFSFGMLLPLLFGVGGPYYEVSKFHLPRLTRWFVRMYPWGLIGTAPIVCSVLIAFRVRGRYRTSQILNWLAIVCIALITLIGTLAFLLPFMAVMSGLRG